MTFEYRTLALGLRVFKHFFQGLHPHRNFALQLGQLGQYLRWRTVLHLRMHHFLVVVDAQVVAVGGDVGFGYAEALRGAGVG